MTDEGPPPQKRMKISRDQLETMSKEELIEKFHEQEAYIDQLPFKHEGEPDEEKASKQSESSRRENVLMMRLTSKEHELQDCMNQIGELKQAQNASTAQLRSMLLDPAVNLMFQRMKKEMDACKEKLDQAQNDLAAWKFTPDSQTGKRLMAKCRMLLQENDELGKVISSGRTAKLEGEIALEKTLVKEMKKSQAEMDELVQELDEDVEGMQSTIYLLQQQLKETKEQLAVVQKENEQLRAEQSAAAAAAAAAAKRTSVASARTPSPLLGQPVAPSVTTDKYRYEERSGSPQPPHSPSPPPHKQDSQARQHRQTADSTNNSSRTQHLVSNHTSLHSQNSTSNTNGSHVPHAHEPMDTADGVPDSSDEAAATDDVSPDNTPIRSQPQTKELKVLTANPSSLSLRNCEISDDPIDNTDATSSGSWSPQNSKQSTKLGSAEEDEEDDDMVVNEPERTTAKAGSINPETLHNGQVVGHQYDSQGDEEEEEEDEA